MVIKHLNNQERDLTLADRESGQENGDTVMLLALRARIEAAKHQSVIERKEKQAVPVSRCPCFKQGWLAAIAEIEHGGGA